MQVKSLAEFSTAVAETVLEWTPKNVDWYLQPWFRGHGDASWSLKPGWYRQAGRAGGLGDEYYVEANLLEKFRLRGPTYLDRIRTNDWEWLFLDSDGSSRGRSRTTMVKGFATSMGPPGTNRGPFPYKIPYFSNRKPGCPSIQ